MRRWCAASTGRARVSVLFSEPKIPQFSIECCDTADDPSFSALQRAENSSIYASESVVHARACFSALQRAENSSIKHILKEI